MGNIDIGIYLRKRRISLELSLEQIANYCGVSKSTVSRWENGKIDEIKRGHIYLLAKKLYIPVEVILGLENTENVEPANIVLKREKIIHLLSQINDYEKIEQVEKFINTFILDK